MRGSVIAITPSRWNSPSHLPQKERRL